jgi:hypothetical protein
MGTTGLCRTNPVDVHGGCMIMTTGGENGILSLIPPESNHELIGAGAERLN